MSYLEILKKIRQFEVYRSETWQQLLRVEPENPDELFSILVQLSSSEINKIWCYLLEKLLFFDNWNVDHKNFVLKVLSIPDTPVHRIVHSHHIIPALFSFGLEKNSRIRWLISVLEITDPLELLPHLTASTLSGNLLSFLNDWSRKIAYLPFEEMKHILTSLGHIEKLIASEDVEQLEEAILTFIHQFKFVLDERCLFTKPDSFSREECETLSLLLFQFSRKCYENKLLEKEEFLSIAFTLKLPGAIILGLYDNLDSLTVEDYIQLWCSIEYSEHNKSDLLIDRLADSLFRTIYLINSTKTVSDDDITKILSMYEMLIKQGRLSLSVLTAQLLEDICRDKRGLFESSLYDWVKKDIDPHYLTIPRIISAAYSGNFTEPYQLTKNWFESGDLPYRGFIEILKELLTANSQTVEKSTAFPELMNQIKELFKKESLDYQIVVNKARERSLQEVAVAVNLLRGNIRILNPEVIKQNLEMYPELKEMFENLVNNLLENKEHNHDLLKMLNTNNPYLHRLNTFVTVIPDVINKREIKNSIKDNGEEMWHSFSELEIAYLFKTKLNIEITREHLEQHLYQGSRQLDFCFDVGDTRVWVEVKKYYESDEAELYTKAVSIPRDKFGKNIWSKFQAKFPDITDDIIETINDPVILAVNEERTFGLGIDVEKYLTGTTVEEMEYKEGKLVSRGTYKENDAMSQRSPETRIVSGILLFKLRDCGNSRFILETKYINNPHCKNPLSVKIINAIINKLS